jgi:hypothetical protein
VLPLFALQVFLGFLDGVFDALTVVVATLGRFTSSSGFLRCVAHVVPLMSFLVAGDGDICYSINLILYHNPLWINCNVHFRSVSRMNRHVTDA